MNETQTPQIEIKLGHRQAINALAREWADYAGGFKQAQKIVREAYELGLAFRDLSPDVQNINGNDEKTKI